MKNYTIRWTGEEIVEAESEEDAMKLTNPDNVIDWESEVIDEEEIEGDADIDEDSSDE